MTRIFDAQNEFNAVFETDPPEIRSENPSSGIIVKTFIRSGDPIREITRLTLEILYFGSVPDSPQGPFLAFNAGTNLRSERHNSDWARKRQCESPPTENLNGESLTVQNHEEN
jgi:hypothetical protein